MQWRLSFLVLPLIPKHFKLNRKYYITDGHGKYQSYLLKPISKHKINSLQDTLIGASNSFRDWQKIIFVWQSFDANHNLDNRSDCLNQKIWRIIFLLHFFFFKLPIFAEYKSQSKSTFVEQFSQKPHFITVSTCRTFPALLLLFF